VTARVALFATCVGDQFFADACADAVRLLRHLGVDVDVPSGQTCCGQPAYKAGHRPQARRMARHTDAVFRGFDHVVLPSGSCAGMMRCFYPELLDHDRATPGASSISRTADAGTLSLRTYELAQYVVQVLGVTDLGRGLSGKRVAYHHGCHALRELDVHDEPLALLRGCGAEVVQWVADQECCGFGGLFSTKLPEVSAGMADRKLDTLPPVDFATSADGGCLLQLSGRASRRTAPAPPFRHLASVLWEGVAP
jgi:L-lactate dehydrogenase complex protein LldE